MSEHVRIVAVQARALQRRAAGGFAPSRLMGWRATGGERQGPLVIVPQDMRSRDPSFWDEIESGSFGLSGQSVELAGRSPFQIRHSNPVWLENLHGFGWLRHLEASGELPAQMAARDYVLDWLGQSQSKPLVANTPAVRARRILSWLSHATYLLDGADAPQFDAIGRGIEREVHSLSATWRAAGVGPQRLLALTALVAAHLAIKGRERQLSQMLALLDLEIDRQILVDGGHISRSPAVLIELLLDWLPLKSCFEARKLAVSDHLAGAIDNMLAMLRFLRLGDGAVARFNGTGVGDPASLATLSGYDDKPVPSWGIAPQSRYARMERGDSIIVADTGAAPPLQVSGEAHAGCLSFEMSVGHALLFVNAGAPGAADSDWRAVSRATASHSTLCLGEVSSSKLVRHGGLEAMVGGVPLQLPANVPAMLETRDGTLHLAASHDGYLGRLELIHARELDLDDDGAALRGTDRLGTKDQGRLRHDVPFSIHFHLHPDASCMREAPVAGAPETLVIRLRNGQRWLFRATAAAMTIEESIFFTTSSGPRPSTQIVLRGACAGQTDVHWSVVLDGPKTATHEIGKPA